MDEYIPSLKCAHQRYKDAFTAAFAEFTAATGHDNSDLAIESAIQKLNEQHEGYLLASKVLRDFVEMRLRELEVAHHNITMPVSQALADLDLNEMALDLAILNLNENLAHFLLASRKLRLVEVHTNATEAAPVGPENAQPRDPLPPSSKGQGHMKSDTQHGDEADLSEQHKTSLAQDLTDLDLNRPEEEKTVENNTDSLEDTVEHKMAASQLPDHDTNKKA